MLSNSVSHTHRHVVILLPFSLSASIFVTHSLLPQLTFPPFPNPRGTKNKKISEVLTFILIPTVIFPRFVNEPAKQEPNKARHRHNIFLLQQPHKLNMTASVLFFSEGDSLYNVGDYEGAIKNYTAAITTNSRSVNATTDGDEATIDDNRDAAETKVVQFRSLSHRSEAYLSLSKYEHAYADARAALALYSRPDSVDDFSASSFGLRPWEMEAAHDRVTRALAGILAIVISSLQHPHENVKFVASSRVAFPPNAELQREDMQDDTSVLKQNRFY